MPDPLSWQLLPYRKLLQPPPPPTMTALMPLPRRRETERNSETGLDVNCGTDPCGLSVDFDLED